MSTPENPEVVHSVGDDSVLILGGGPVGLMTASVLAFYGVKSVVLERNSEPTKWPKMDLTNARSMELLRKIGLSEGLRRKGVDESTITSEEAVYTVLGGFYEPFEIWIDEILVRSTFQPSIAVANNFAGPELRLFLAGDSAHMNIPTGGYGMNTGMGDAFDIAWKLAAVINGYGGEGLLRSYEQERKPIAAQNVGRSGVHMSVHLAAVELMGKNAAEIDKKSEEGLRIRNSIHQHYSEHDGENTDLGIEMGYRYVSPVCMPDESEDEPTWDPHTYLPTTWPGSRAPHVFLKDESPIFDHLGPAFSLVEFSDEEQPDRGSSLLVEAAKVLGLPMSYVTLVGEDHAASVWQKPLVLVRPDGHVAWRGISIQHPSQAYLILETIVGHHGSA
ncbi:hypothetical protein G7Z17_g938 [Cylindrodendrum hubeiense]|uniref:FAD-binding domain-containing protein n=1 Tax=Cylindrodendrum hubeiense TaxID=595255 RepID=A0A9P5LMM7_9HYPO|nr:hypothetical protein G7Z17_g938 [Cylindrodendrum hubeiense]